MTTLRNPDGEALCPPLRMMTPKEAAEMLHVHGNTLRRWSDRGIIAAYRICDRGDRRYLRDDVYRMIYDWKSRSVSGGT
jgi:excisionase family DNA binding protein